MDHLKEVTDKLKSSASQTEKMESLSKAFEIFSEESLRLEAAYSSLNQHFQLLNLELQESNHRLQNKVAELDIITQYLKSVLDNISQGIIFIDFQGIITTYNSAAESILNLRAHAVLKTPFWKHFEDRTFGFSMREALYAKRAPSFSSMSYKHPQAPYRDLEISTTFALNKSPEPSPTKPHATTQGLILMIRDITEVRYLQMIANRADRLKELGEMAAQVAHEIRNPLGGIKGFAALLCRDLADRPQLQQMATYIIEGTDELNRLVNQVLQFARPVHPHYEPIEIISWLDELRQHVLADPAVQANRISIDLKHQTSKIILYLDGALFKSALLNLIVNAIHAMPGGGTVTLNAEATEETAQISVSDTGVGIPKEHLAKIYSPFFTTKSDGTGLGLAEVQKVVQAHGGSVEVASEVEKGTTFTLSIPIKTKVAL